MKRPNLNLRHIRVYCEVAKYGSISAAQDYIHLTQPAITQALNKLEKLLDARLLTRANTGTQLTEQGNLFHERALRILSLLELGVQKAVSEEQKRTRRSVSNFSRLLTLMHLHSLVCVADASSFSAAARNMPISQPSLHRIARDLERLADILFFKSVGRGVKLTKPALAFVAYARLVLAEIDQAIAELREYQGIEDSVIVVGTLPLVRTAILPKAINRFAVQFPQSVISVIDGPYDELLSGLRRGKLDFLIGALRDKPPFDDVEQKPLFQDRLAIFGRKDHPLKYAKNPSPVELAEYPWAVPRQGTPTRSYFDLFFENLPKNSTKKSFGKPERIIETSSLVLMRALITDSDRLTMISPRQIALEEQNEIVVRLDVELFDEPRPIGITSRKDWRPTKSQSIFMDLINKQCDYLK